MSILIILSTFSRANTDEPVRLTMATQENYSTFPVNLDLREFVANALKKENIIVTFVPLPAYRGSALVDKGEVDSELARDKSSLEGLKNVITTSKPLAFVETSVIYLKSNKKYDRKNLKKLRCGIPLNHKTIKKKIELDGFSCIEIDNPPQALKLLEGNRVDYVIYPQVTIAAQMEQPLEWSHQFVLDEKSYMQFELYLVLNRKHSELLPKIEQALRNAIKTDLPKYKRLQKIVNKDF